MVRLRALHIYDAPDCAGLDIGQIAGYLASLLPPVVVDTRRDFFTHHLARFTPEQVEILTAELSKRLAERELAQADLDPELGPVYDAAALQDVLRPLLPQDERDKEHLHVVMLCPCLADRDSSGGVQLRILQPGTPALISTTCLVEAPQLPREYLFRRAQLEAFGLHQYVEELEDEFSARTLGHADPRLTLVARGYALQALFYHLFGESGCNCSSCPLYEARDHDELMRAHLGPEAGLCARHRRMLREACEALQ